MSSKSKINLLPKDQFEYSTAGKLIKWAVSVGRWIVVLTEFVVICAFISRFYFDTVLANLFDDIKQKKAIVSSASAFEETFRQTQTKLKVIKTLLAEEKRPSVVIEDIGKAMPLDATLSQVIIEDTKITLSGSALSENSLKIFLAQLLKNPKLNQVSLTNISSQKEALPGVVFTISANLKQY